MKFIRHGPGGFWGPAVCRIISDWASITATPLQVMPVRIKLRVKHKTRQSFLHSQAASTSLPLTAASVIILPAPKIPLARGGSAGSNDKSDCCGLRVADGYFIIAAYRD